MDAKSRELVRQRADWRCEYCHFRQSAVPYLVFHVDHIVAKQHLDEVSDDPAELAWACSECNYHKGPNLASIDPITLAQVDLFNPAPMSGKRTSSSIVGRSSVSRQRAARPLGYST